MMFIERPVIDNFRSFTPERLESIRINRELTLRDGLIELSKGKKKKESKPRSKTSSSRTKSKPKPLTLTAASRAALERMDPALRAMFEQQMKLK